MTGPQARGSIAARDGVLAALAAALVLVLALVAVGQSRTLALERRAAADEAVVADLSRRVALAIEETMASVADRARSATLALPPPPVPPGATGIDPEVTAVLDRARDTGEVVLGRMVDLGDGARPFVVAPVYEREATATLPATTVDRRARLRGWIFETVDVQALMAAAVPRGQVASIREGSAAVTSGGKGVPERLPARVLERRGHQYVIQAGDPAGVAVARSTIALVVTALVLAIVAATAVVLVRRRLRADRAEAEDRAAQIRLIGDVGPLVQQSLELADVLPAIAIQLSDHFELGGVSLSTFGGDGRPINLFSFGVGSDHSVKPVLRPPEHLARGETLVLALERGGRSVAQLRLVAGRPLDGSELQSMRAITELITAAVANASLYASQQEAMRRLRDLDALKTGFLGTASHELRTPVTAIGGFAQLLTDSWDRFDDEQRRHFVERIGANARSLGAVVQDLLDFSLLDRGTIVLELVEVDLGVVAGAVVDRLGPLFTEHEIAFTAAPVPPVAADINGLERAISNLLTNAVKFSPAGTTVTVSVGASANDGFGAELSVSDQGPGVPAEERAQVFARFFRGGGDEVMRTRGVGIGLSVVAEMVALLNGEVEVGEAPGGGARFTLRFPVAVSNQDDEETAHAPTA